LKPIAASVVRFSELPPKEVYRRLIDHTGRRLMAASEVDDENDRFGVAGGDDDSKGTGEKSRRLGNTKRIR
jgi:hypothetical protein